MSGSTLRELEAEVAKCWDEIRLQRERYGTALAEIAALTAERDRLRALTATCSCGTSPMTYQGPEPDCPVHGAVRAYNEAAADRDALAARLERAEKVVEAARLLWKLYETWGGVGNVDPSDEQVAHGYAELMDLEDSKRMDLAFSAILDREVEIRAAFAAVDSYQTGTADGLRATESDERREGEVGHD